MMQNYPYISKALPEGITERDKELISEAESYYRYDFYKVKQLIPKAETQAAADRLTDIYWMLYDLREETL